MTTLSACAALSVCLRLDLIDIYYCCGCDSSSSDSHHRHPVPQIIGTHTTWYLCPQPLFFSLGVLPSFASPACRLFRCTSTNLRLLSNQVALLASSHITALRPSIEVATKIPAFYERCRMPIMTKSGERCGARTMIPHPRFGCCTSIIARLLITAMFCIASVSAQLSVQYVTSVKGYPTSGGLIVTVYGSGFGSTSTALSVKIGSTVCTQPAIIQQHARIACKLGKFTPLFSIRSCSLQSSNVLFRRCLRIGSSYCTHRFRHCRLQLRHNRFFQIRSVQHGVIVLSSKYSLQILP